MKNIGILRFRIKTSIYTNRVSPSFILSEIQDEISTIFPKKLTNNGVQIEFAGSGYSSGMSNHFGKPVNYPKGKIHLETFSGKHVVVIDWDISTSLAICLSLMTFAIVMMVNFEFDLIMIFVPVFIIGIFVPGLIFQFFMLRSLIKTATKRIVS